MIKMLMDSEIFQLLMLLVIIKAIFYAIVCYRENPKENGKKALGIFVLTIIIGFICALAITGIFAAILGYALIIFIFIVLLLIL